MLSLGRDMSRVRPPAVAGLFYPLDARELRRAVEAYIDACPRRDPAVRARELHYEI